MIITLKLLANLGEYLPRDEQGRRPYQLPVEVAQDSDVQSVIDRFRLPPKHVHLVLINGVYVAPAARSKYRLKEGDAVAIWPQIAGG